jgi:hypothetical protein
MGELGGWFPNALDIHPFKYLAFKAFRPLPGIVQRGSETRQTEHPAGYMK